MSGRSVTVASELEPVVTVAEIRSLPVGVGLGVERVWELLGLGVGQPLDAESGAELVHGCGESAKEVEAGVGDEVKVLGESRGAMQVGGASDDDVGDAVLVQDGEDAFGL